MPAPRPFPESLQDGRYRLLALLGAGGHADVYWAVDTRLNVPRAIKILDSRNVELFRALQLRLRSEAEALARIRHPNVVGIHDIGTDPPYDYIVMDLAEGGSVAQWIEENGTVPVEVALEWMLDILSALAAAHSASIVHRDVKPGNILLDADGRPLLADFGIAMLGEADLRRTTGGMGFGSIQFMPPEQRLDASSVDQRADLFAAGATLYAMLTAKSPIDLFLAEGPTSPRWKGLPPAIADVIRKACALRPSDRYASAGAMAVALLAAVPEFQRRPGSYPPPRLRTRARPLLPPVEVVPVERSRRAPIGAAMAAAALVFAAGAGLYLDRVETPAPAPAPPPAVVTMPLAPAPAPTPIVAAPPAPKPPQPSLLPRRQELPPEAPFGRWRVYANGAADVDVTLDLAGEPHAVEGRVRSRLAERVDEQPVTGSYAADERLLVLTDGAGARYRLTLDPALRRGEGTVEAGGRVRAANVAWEPR